MLKEYDPVRATSINIEFYLNSELVCLKNPKPTSTLLEFLRLNKKLRGTKEGCAEGDCGACTVLIGRLDKKKELVYASANACIVFLPSIASAHIISIEGLRAKDGGLHPIQRAMISNSGAQCGFCTPGFVMSLYAVWLSEERLTKKTILKSIQGNLCRCTGYGPIIDAALEVSNVRSKAKEELSFLKNTWTSKLAKLQEKNRFQSVSVKKK